MGRISEAAKRKQVEAQAQKPDPKAAKAPTRPAATAPAEPAKKPFEEDLEDDELDEEEEIIEDEGDDIEDDEEIEDDEAEEESDEEDSDEEESDEDDEEDDLDDDDDDFLDDDEEDEEEDEKALAKSASKSTDPGSFSAKRKKVILDFEGADDKPPTIAPGEYNARVNDAEHKMSSSDQPMIEWTFKITSGPHKNADLRFWSSMKQDARWATARVLKALGISVAGKKSYEFDPEKLIGKPCKIVVVHDGRNEDFPHKVQRVLPADAAAVKAAKAAKDLI